jgi:hypothetical protein
VPNTDIKFCPVIYSMATLEEVRGRLSQINRRLTNDMSVVYVDIGPELSRYGWVKGEGFVCSPHMRIRDEKNYEMPLDGDYLFLLGYDFHIGLNVKERSSFPLKEVPSPLLDKVLQRIDEITTVMDKMDDEFLRS